MDALSLNCTVAALTVITLLLSILRRSFIETPNGSLHKLAESWGVAEEFDTREKFHRIGATVMLLNRCSASLWSTSILLVFFWHPWFGPQLVTADEVSLVACANLVGVLLVGMIPLFELLPDVLASVRGEGVALASLRFLWTLDTLFSPLSRTFRASRRLLLRVVGNGHTRTEAEVAEEGIRNAVEMGEREGVLLEGEKSMIESLLEFHDADVSEAMTPRTDMVCVDGSRSIADVIPEIIDCGHSRIPVYRENIDDIVAVLYVKDLLRFNSDPERAALAVEEAARPANFVPETKKLSELLAEFRSNRFHIAIILDEYGGTAGLVTIEDILEEIVGEIEDEYDHPEEYALIKTIDPDTFEVDGRAHVDEVSEAIAQPLPESDDYETIAGFLFCTLGKVPKVGEAHEHENLRFEVTEADERKIQRVRVHVLQPHSQDANQK